MSPILFTTNARDWFIDTLEWTTALLYGSLQGLCNVAGVLKAHALTKHDACAYWQAKEQWIMPWCVRILGDIVYNTRHSSSAWQWCNCAQPNTHKGFQSPSLQGTSVSPILQPVTLRRKRNGPYHRGKCAYWCHAHSCLVLNSIPKSYLS